MIKIIVAIVLSFIATMPAFADNKGFSLGVNVSQTHASSGSASPTGYTLLMGYQFNKYFGIDWQYSHFGNIAASNFLNARADVVGIRFAAVGTYPFTDQWGIYGKLGIADTSTDLSGTPGHIADGIYVKVTASYGAGVEYKVNQSLGIRVGADQYTMGGSNASYTLSDSNLTVVSAGVNYVF